MLVLNLQGFHSEQLGLLSKLPGDLELCYIDRGKLSTPWSDVVANTGLKCLGYFIALVKEWKNVGKESYF